MIDELDNLRVQNTQEALRQIQRYTSIAMATALALALLEFTSTRELVQVPGLPILLEPMIAIVLLIPTYVACGFLLYSAIVQADKLAREIEDVKIRDLACSLPTFATFGDAGVKWAANLLAPGFFLLYIGLRFWHDDGRSFEEYFALLLFGLAPYGGFLYQLRMPLGSSDAT